MLSRHAFPLPLVVLTVCALRPLSAAGLPNVVAEVNGEKITKSELISVMSDWHAPTDLEELVRCRTVDQAARKAGVVVTQAQIDAEVAKIKTDSISGPSVFIQLRQRGITKEHMYSMIRMRLQAEGVVRKSMNITQKDLDGYRRGSQILLFFRNGAAQDAKGREAQEQEIKAKMESIAQEIKNGLPFEEAVKKYSDDAATKTNGGDLGWFTRDRVVYDLSPAFFSMKTGEISRPIKTSYGYFLVKLTGIGSEAKGKERAQAVEALTQLRLLQEVQPWLSNLTSKAIVKNILEPERSQTKPRPSGPSANPPLPAPAPDPGPSSIPGVAN